MGTCLAKGNGAPRAPAATPRRAAESTVRPGPKPPGSAPLVA